MSCNIVVCCLVYMSGLLVAIVFSDTNWGALCAKYRMIVVSSLCAKVEIPKRSRSGDKKS